MMLSGAHQVAETGFPVLTNWHVVGLINNHLCIQLINRTFCIKFHKNAQATCCNRKSEKHSSCVVRESDWVPFLCSEERWMKFS